MQHRNKTAKNNEYVMMCGDGANDCAALKTADAGISLADSEASIAAPFTSKVQDISCVPALLLEGRSCLEVIILSFRFVMFSALAEGMTVTSLNYIGTNLKDHQFLYVDLFVVFPLAILMCYTKANQVMTSRLPAESMLSLKVLLTTLLQSLIQVTVAILAFTMIKDNEPQFIDCKVQEDDEKLKACS